MTDGLNAFSYNILIANLHEMQNFFYKELNKKYTKKTLIENFSKILITMTPIIPHLANECLKKINYNFNKWPEYDEELLTEDYVNIVIQINGRKRGLIKAKKDIKENELIEDIKNEKNINKYLENSDIRKKIYIPNKIMNIII